MLSKMRRTAKRVSAMLRFQSCEVGQSGRRNEPSLQSAPCPGRVESPLDRQPHDLSGVRIKARCFDQHDTIAGRQEPESEGDAERVGRVQADQRGMGRGMAEDDILRQELDVELRTRRKLQVPTVPVTLPLANECSKRRDFAAERGTSRSRELRPEDRGDPLAERRVARDGPAPASKPFAPRSRPPLIGSAESRGAASRAVLGCPKDAAAYRPRRAARAGSPRSGPR